MLTAILFTDASDNMNFLQKIQRYVYSILYFLPKGEKNVE
jgi:hypothetical protein